MKPASKQIADVSLDVPYQVPDACPFRYDRYPP